MTRGGLSGGLPRISRFPRALCASSSRRSGYLVVAPAVAPGRRALERPGPTSPGACVCGAGGEFLLSAMQNHRGSGDSYKTSSGSHPIRNKPDRASTPTSTCDCFCTPLWNRDQREFLAQSAIARADKLAAKPTAPPHARNAEKGNGKGKGKRNGSPPESGKGKGSPTHSEKGKGNAKERSRERVAEMVKVPER